MATLLRFLFLVPLAYVSACLAAAFALLWPFMNTAGARSGDPFFWVQAAVGFAGQAAQVGSVTLVPFAVFMAVTELLGWRSLLLHAGAGLLGSYAVIRLAYGEALPHASVRTALVVAGVSFALVYWILAGHGAGRWRPSRRAAPTPPPPPPLPPVPETVETSKAP